MEAGAVLGLIGGYVATAVGVFLLYSPILVLAVCLLLTAGLLQLLAWPFIAIVRRLRRKPEPPQDGSWLLR